VKGRHFRRPSAWTSLRCRFRLSYVTRERFCGVFRGIDLAAWQVLYAGRRAPLDWALELLPSIAEEFCEESWRLTFPRFFYRHSQPVGKANIVLYCGRDWICRRSKSAPEYFGISSVKPLCSIQGLWIPIDPARKVARTYPASCCFISAPREADPMSVVTRPSEGTHPEPTSAMVTRSRAREGRRVSVAPEAQIEPEIETRPEQEIATCAGGFGAARPFPTDTGSLFTFSDKPEMVTAHTSQEVTETSHFTAPSQTTPLHTLRTTTNFILTNCRYCGWEAGVNSELSQASTRNQKHLEGNALPAGCKAKCWAPRVVTCYLNSNLGTKSAFDCLRFAKFLPHIFFKSCGATYRHSFYCFIVRCKQSLFL